jgi:1,2-phenylacetyl-CoA epoxidase catalytic subunit
MSNKELIELFMFTVNEKVNSANMIINNYSTEKYNVSEEFYRGQWMAFNEVYSMLKNQLNHETED